MNRKPILTVLICYCLVVLVLAVLGVATLPSAACADGNGGPEPPTQPPNDSTLNASNPTESTPVTVTEPMPEKSLTLRMYLEIVAGIIL